MRDKGDTSTMRDFVRTLAPVLLPMGIGVAIGLVWYVLLWTGNIPVPNR